MPLLDHIILVDNFSISRDQGEFFCSVWLCKDEIKQMFIKLYSFRLPEMRTILCCNKKSCVPFSCWVTIVRSYLPVCSSFRTFISSVMRAVNLWRTDTWIQISQMSTTGDCRFIIPFLVCKMYEYILSITEFKQILLWTVCCSVPFTFEYKLIFNIITCRPYMSTSYLVS